VSEPALVKGRPFIEGENVEITSGTILIEKNALHPQCFQLRDHAYPDAWMRVTHDLTRPELEKQLRATGWTFFYMASAIRTRSFGFDRAKTIHAALKRIIANVKKQKCNCLEIDGVTAHSFLGMPYVSVSAHPRHIQKGMVFSGR
jgi:hypothetical protein